MCLCLFFFLYCYGAHRDLHSFPTRRSSDLKAALGRATPRDLGALRDSILRLPDARAALDGLEHRGRGDRKSTRLNSSHVAISYAVFCLKKKKTKKERS